MQWIYSDGFKNLSSEDLYKMLRLRQEVFIIEQNCVFDDIDNLDPLSGHLLLKNDVHVIGCSRIVPAQKKFPQPSIGRIAVHKKYRKKGFGREIVQKSLEILSHKNTDTVIIEAQYGLQAFYESMGFKKISDPYSLDDILHIKMTYSFSSQESNVTDL